MRKFVKLNCLLIFLALFTIVGSNFSTSAQAAEEDFHLPIYINGNAMLNDFCSGNGTAGSYSNPHVIEDYIIDAEGTGSGINIRNTDLYLIIQNCTVTNSGTATFDAGLFFENCASIKKTFTF